MYQIKSVVVNYYNTETNKNYNIEYSNFEDIKEQTYLQIEDIRDIYGDRNIKIDEVLLGKELHLNIKCKDYKKTIKGENNLCGTQMI